MAIRRAITRVQQIIGVLLFYARAVDCTQLVALSDLSTQQSKPTARTLAAITKLLNYCATHPDAVLRYVATDMYLWVHSDASYLSEPKSKSCYAGHFYLSDRPKDESKPPKPDDPPPTDNGAILNPTHTLKMIVSAAAEAEFAGVFYNGKDACPIRQTLEELGFPQGPTPIQTDNSTAAGIANDSITQLW